jgi:hypothetical protein
VPNPNQIISGIVPQRIVTGIVTWVGDTYYEAPDNSGVSYHHWHIPCCSILPEQDRPDPLLLVCALESIYFVSGICLDKWLEGKQAMTDLCERRHEGADEFLGVWEEVWYARARRANQAERYRSWLCQQGYSRDEAAEMALRFLAERPARRIHHAAPQRRHLIH